MQRLAIYFLKRFIITAMIISIIVLLAKGDSLSPAAMRGFMLLLLAGILTGVARFARIWAFHSGWVRTQAAQGRMRLLGNSSLIAIIAIFVIGLIQLVIVEFTP